MKKLLLALLTISSLSGCLVSMANGGANLTAEKYHQDKNISKKPHVYAMRGLLGVFSTGMDTLVDKINHKLHYPAVALSHLESKKLIDHIIRQKQQQKLNGPIILVGHSYGADSIVDVAQQLEHAQIPVQMLIPIDNTASKTIPANVKKVVHVHSGASAFSQMLFGWGRAFKVDQKRTKLLEVNTSKRAAFKQVNHFNIDEHQEIINYLLKTIKQG